LETDHAAHHNRIKRKQRHFLPGSAAVFSIFDLRLLVLSAFPFAGFGLSRSYSEED
jgi:hypothetical protein